MHSPDHLRQAIAAETRDLQLLRATLPMKQLVALLDALVDAHLVDLVTLAPEHLGYKQGAIRQLQALRAALLDDNPHISPKA